MKAAAVPALAAALLLAGCADRNPMAAGGTPPPVPALQRLDCAVRVSEATLVCNAARGLAGGARGDIIGGQNLNVRLASSSVAYDSAKQTLSADVTVQNLLGQAMGTLDGATADSAGVRVFFHSGPTVAEGSGIVSVSNADGTDAFTAAQQPFFRYPGILAPGKTSAAKRWAWHVEPTVQLFTFTLYVDTRLSPALVINEIMAAPSTASEADGEWFEIHNAGRDSISLAGWTIASGGDAGYTITGPLVIRKGEYLVLGTSTDADANGGAPVAHAYTGVRLGNDTGDWLALRSPAGVTVDSVHWGAAAGETPSPPPAGAALALDPWKTGNLHLSGAGSGWAPAVETFGGGQRGSPGARNLGPVSLAMVAPGLTHACGVDAAGQAWCWGYNRFGQLGLGAIGDVVPYVTPVSQAGATFTQVATGDMTSCALDSAGAAYCWGDSDYASWPRRLAPTRVPAPDSVQFERLSGGTSAFCGLRDGQAWCWGSLPGFDSVRISAVAIPQPSGVRFSRMAIGVNHFCGVDDAGQAYCAGWNQAGQLGDGSTVERSTLAPVQHPDGVSFAEIAAGFMSTCALSTAGRVFCWGYDSPLLPDDPDNVTPGPLTPQEVQLPAGMVFTRVAVGSFHACALASSGQAYCWGNNQAGALGDGTLENSATPVAVSQRPGSLFAALAAAGSYACAVEQGTGQPFCWGGNVLGNLGNGTTQNAAAPVPAGR